MFVTRQTAKGNTSKRVLDTLLLKSLDDDAIVVVFVEADLQVGLS
jgi:hypothetical protein